MRKMTIVKIAAAVLFALWLFFGDGKTSHRFVVLVAVVVGYQVYSRVKTQHAIQEGARLGMIELMQQHDFKPEHQHFHSSGNQVSGVAISKDDPRIVLASAGVPARLFHRSDVLGLASEKGKEKELQFKLLSMTGAGDKQVNKDVYVVWWRAQRAHGKHRYAENGNGTNHDKSPGHDRCQRSVGERADDAADREDAWADYRREIADAKHDFRKEMAERGMIVRNGRVTVED